MAKNEIKYLTAIKQEKPKKKFCRFKKYGIKYVDYKDIDFLKKFVNEQGKMLPRRLSGNSLKYQRKVADAIKKILASDSIKMLGFWELKKMYANYINQRCR